jgi:hypothetical protein
MAFTSASAPIPRLLIQSIFLRLCSQEFHGDPIAVLVETPELDLGHDISLVGGKKVPLGGLS